jgi:hypothetical protein
MRGLLSGNEEHAAAGFDTLNELVKPKIPSYVRETFSAFGVDYTKSGASTMPYETFDMCLLMISNRKSKA